MKVSKVQGKLELKNSGGLSLFFIGAGSAFSKVNFQNNFLITAPKFQTSTIFSSPIPTLTTSAEWKKLPLLITIQKKKGQS